MFWLGLCNVKVVLDHMYIYPVLHRWGSLIAMNKQVKQARILNRQRFGLEYYRVLNQIGASSMDRKDLCTKKKLGSWTTCVNSSIRESK